MSTTMSPIRRPTVYPESDGKLMAENTRQFDFITLIKGGLDIVFAAREDVFVAGDLLWYPEDGNNQLCAAPDAMVVFGRPKGVRSSYLQWLEDNIPPQVVFEVLSPSNFQPEMVLKRDFYSRHGVEEYFVYDPDRGLLSGYVRGPSGLELLPNAGGLTSSLLGVRMQLNGNDLELFGPDGRPFLNTIELDEAARLAEQRADIERKLAEAERQRAEAQQQRAEAQQQRAEAQQQRADNERERAERLAAKLRELGIDPSAL